MLKIDDITLKDIGYEDQFNIWNRIKNTGASKIIVDTDDLLNDPETILKLICNTLEITWYSQMLSWKKDQNLLMVFGRLIGQC